MKDADRKIDHRGRFVRFLLVGILNTGVGYLFFAVFVLLGVDSQLALALAFIFGVMWNFWAHARMVFQQGGLRRFPAYVAVYVVIWWLNSMALQAAEQAGLTPLLAQAFLAPFAAVLSFVFIAKALTGSFPFGK